jgi:hypothetical protein
LKQNWSDLLHEYQGLSVVVDNLSKRLRKKSLEEKLSQLEADIKRIEQHKVIYVDL